MKELLDKQIEELDVESFRTELSLLVKKLETIEENRIL
jgi:hypothetical protein